MIHRRLLIAVFAASLAITTDSCIEPMILRSPDEFDEQFGTLAETITPGADTRIKLRLQQDPQNVQVTKLHSGCGFGYYNYLLEGQIKKSSAGDIFYSTLLCIGRGQKSFVTKRIEIVTKEEGSIVLEVTAELSPTAENHYEVKGSFQVIESTGNYSGAEGSGYVSGKSSLIDEEADIDITLDGTIRIG